MKVIAVINQKGGSGKTTTACNLAAGIGMLGKRTLLIDLDPQGHLTQSMLGMDSAYIEKSIYHALRDDLRLKDATIERDDKLSIVPSSLDLAGLEAEISSLPGREFLLKERLAAVRGYDFCFIDCPPSLGLLTIMALVACQSVLIPLQVEFLALHSVSRMLETIDLIKERLNPGLEILGVVATRFDKRKRLNREVVDNAKTFFKARFFKTAIRENISLAEAPSHGKTIFEYKLMSHGAGDYLNLARDFLRRVNTKQGG